METISTLIISSLYVNADWVTEVRKGDAAKRADSFVRDSSIDRYVWFGHLFIVKDNSQIKRLTIFGYLAFDGGIEYFTKSWGITTIRWTSSPSHILCWMQIGQLRQLNRLPTLRFPRPLINQTNRLKFITYINGAQRLSTINTMTSKCEQIGGEIESNLIWCNFGDDYHY